MTVELDSTNILRWLVVHNIRRHPHDKPPSRQFVVTAHEVYLRERAFYHMLLDVARYLLFLALCLVLVNMRNDCNIFLRNDSVYRQIFNDPHYRCVYPAVQQLCHALRGRRIDLTMTECDTGGGGCSVVTSCTMLQLDQFWNCVTIYENARLNTAGTTYSRPLTTFLTTWHCLELTTDNLPTYF